MMYGYYGPGWGYMGAGGWILMILFWAFIIFGIIALVRWSTHGGGHWHGHGERTALDVLKERYARGEIDRKEFEEKKKDLAQ